LSAGFFALLFSLLVGAAVSVNAASADPWMECRPESPPLPEHIVWVGSPEDVAELPLYHSANDPVLSDELSGDPLNKAELAAIEALLQSIDMFIVPNPNAGKFRLEISGEIPVGAELRIINVEGEKVYSRLIDKAGYLYLNLSPLRKGIYFAQLRVGEKMISHPIIYSYDEADAETAAPLR
jgi:hypothetical protein